MTRDSQDVAVEWGSCRGFSLLEVVVATSLLAGALVALAQLAAMATGANVRARATTVAAVLALEKMEQLRAQGADLRPSVHDALERNITAYCDFFDGVGRRLGGGVSPPLGTVWVRRWIVSALHADPDYTRVMQVRVTRTAQAARPGPGTWQSDAARLVAVKTRKEP